MLQHMTGGHHHLLLSFMVFSALFPIILSENTTHLSPCGFLWFTPDVSSITITDRGTCTYLYFRDSEAIVICFSIICISLIQIFVPDIMLGYRRQIYLMVARFGCSSCCCYPTKSGENSAECQCCAPDISKDPALSSISLHVFHLIMFLISLVIVELTVLFCLLLLISCCLPESNVEKLYRTQVPLASTATPAGSQYAASPSRTKIQFVSKYKPVPNYIPNP